MADPLTENEWARFHIYAPHIRALEVDFSSAADQAWILTNRIHLDKTYPLLPNLQEISFEVSSLFSGVLWHTLLGSELRKLRVSVERSKESPDFVADIGAFFALLVNRCAHLEYFDFKATGYGGASSVSRIRHIVTGYLATTIPNLNALSYLALTINGTPGPLISLISQLPGLQDLRLRLGLEVVAWSSMTNPLLSLERIHIDGDIHGVTDLLSFRTSYITRLRLHASLTPNDTRLRALSQLVNLTNVVLNIDGRPVLLGHYSAIFECRKLQVVDRVVRPITWG